MVDTLGNPVNPARQWFSWRWGNHFSMMDGLSSVTQAAISLGDYDVVAFEKDRVCWTYVQTIISQFIIQQEKQEKQMQVKLKASYEVCIFFHNLILYCFRVQKIVLKVKTEGTEQLSKEEVELK